MLCFCGVFYYYLHIIQNFIISILPVFLFYLKKNLTKDRRYLQAYNLVVE